MKYKIKETLSSILAILGILVVFGRLQSYSWWLIDSYKGALGTIAVLGLAVLLINARELFRFSDLSNFIETALWVIAGTVVIASLFSHTTRAEFIVGSLLVGLAGLAHMVDHFMESNSGHKHSTRYVPIH